VTKLIVALPYLGRWYPGRWQNEPETAILLMILPASPATYLVRTLYLCQIPASLEWGSYESTRASLLSHCHNDGIALPSNHVKSPAVNTEAAGGDWLPCPSDNTTV
jgi:hypothetical protein